MSRFTEFFAKNFANVNIAKEVTLSGKKEHKHCQ
jgi:hypothetical protein